MARILIVEDDPPSRDYLRTLLTATHHQVSEAGDGMEALKFAHAERPDLIITDILMPTMDGFEFVRQLRKDPVLASTKVIFCSATYLQRETEALAKSCGVTHTLIKPAEPQEINKAIQEVLSEPQAASPVPDEEFHRQHTGLVSGMAMRKSTELQIANDRLAALIVVGNQLASEPDASHLIEKFCKGARNVLAARYTAVVLRKEDGKRMELAATSGLPANADSPPAFVSLAQIAAKELRPKKKTVRMYDGSVLRMFADPPFLDPLNPVKGCIATVIASGETPYGFLLAAGKVGRQLFTEADEQVAGTLAAQVAIAYENVLRVEKLRTEIGERKRAEEALRESEARLNEAQYNAQIGSWRYIPNGPLVWSDQLYELFKLPRDAPTTYATAVSAIHPEDQAGTNSAFQNALQSSSPGFQAEYRVVWPDGQVRTLFALGKIRREADGRVIEAVGTVQDVTERKRAEEALRRSEAQKRELIEYATYGICRCGPDGKFLEVNTALARILGYESAAQVLALNLGAEVYRYPIERAKFVEHCKRDGQVHGVEVQWLKKDKTPILVRLSARNVRGGPGASEFLEVFAENITELRALEKSNRQLQKFEAIGQLAGGIAHDFNNVIGAILGWSELGQPEVPVGSRVHTYLEKIRKQAERAAALTRQLLAFARLQILERRSISLNESVVQTIGLLKAVIGEQLEIKLALASDLAMTHADRTQIEQVILNLCVNARDAMPEGGELLIETKNVSFDEEYCRRQPYARPGNFVLLSVSDTGQGMDKETMERIFEPFFTTKEIGEGTGLGLATVYGIVKQHDGFIHVYSEPLRGSTFRAYFPKAVGDLLPLERKAHMEPARGGTETILVAEDQEANLEIAKEILEMLGYTVLCAADGEAAVKLFESNAERIALVLLDVIMPKLSGPDALARMRSRKPELPVLFTTGYSTEMTRLELLTRQGAEILQKPYGLAALGQKVREILDRKTSS